MTTLTRSPNAQRVVLAIAIIATLGATAGLYFIPRDFFIAYLVAYIFWWSTALGALALGLLHTLTGGAWGEAARPVFTAAVRTLPALALLFLPLLLGLHHLYPWTESDFDGERAYLNVTAFVVRAIIYFAVWISLAFAWSRGAMIGDARPRLAAAGLVLYSFSTTFAAIDWIMSLAPPWHSSSFGMVVALGQALCAVALALLVLSRAAPTLPPRVWHQLGNVLLALVLLWSYVAFTQYLTIWSADLPHEVTWYLDRQANGWSWLIALVIVFHFALPFLLLLSRARKRSPARLRRLAILLLVAHVLHTEWLIVPSLLPTVDPASVVVQVVVFIALGAIWSSLFLYALRRRERATIAWGGAA